MPLTKPALDPRSVTALVRSGYPEPYRARVLPREKRRLGDALGPRPASSVSPPECAPGSRPAAPTDTS
jgi:hypothetical protein